MPFQIEHQAEAEWCWAAVAASVDRYFDPISAAPQCRIAANVLKRDACGNPEAADLPQTLQAALLVVNRLDFIRIGPLTFDQVRQQIDAGQPVCLRIAWHGGGAHYVVISAYSISPGGVRTVEVSDPLYPKSIRDFDQFPQEYYIGGDWTATFFVKP